MTHDRPRVRSLRGRVLLSVLLMGALAAVILLTRTDAPEGSLTLIVRATAGPTCPVQSVPADPGCADRPVAGALIEVMDANGRRWQETTDPGGLAVFRVDPGAYVVVGGPVEGLMGSPEPDPVEVSGDVQVDLFYDTGIR